MSLSSEDCVASAWVRVCRDGNESAETYPTGSCSAFCRSRLTPAAETTDPQTESSPVSTWDSSAVLAGPCGIMTDMSGLLEPPSTLQSACLFLLDVQLPGTWSLLAAGRRAQVSAATVENAALGLQFRRLPPRAPLRALCLSGMIGLVEGAAPGNQFGLLQDQCTLPTSVVALSPEDPRPSPKRPHSRWRRRSSWILERNSIGFLSSGGR